MRGVFVLGLAVLFTHEMDAMTQGEWRVLPFTNWMPEPVAQWVFVAVHVPLYALLMWFCFHDRRAVRELARLLVGAFLIVHVGLHSLFSSHPHYEFEGPLSLALIWGGGLLGGLYLLGRALPGNRYPDSGE